MQVYLEYFAILLFYRRGERMNITLYDLGLLAWAIIVAILLYHSIRDYIKERKSKKLCLCGDTINKEKKNDDH